MAPSPKATGRAAFILVAGTVSGVLAYHELGPRDAPALLDDFKPVKSISRPSAIVGAAPSTRFRSPIDSGARLKEVVDGDTLAVIGDDNLETIVRLADIDAPSLDQPYGPQARAELRRLTANARLRIISGGVTSNGMAYAHILADGIDVGSALVRAGAARVAGASSPPADLMALEEEARAAQAGLWSLPASDRIRPCWRRSDC